ncbi:hypothetical protein EMIT040CA3_60008 [Bacillus pseudomycoides]
MHINHLMFIVILLIINVNGIMINNENGAILIKKKWSEKYESS